METMKAAKNRVVITPPVGTPIAGNVRLDNKSRGVHDDLYCNILILDDHSRKICLLGCDLIYLQYSTCSDIRGRIEKATGIPASDIVMWATHTHSGPDTGMQMYQSSGEPQIKDYLKTMSSCIVEGVIRANEKYEEVTLQAGSKRVPDLNFNRRLVRKDGSVVMNFEEFDAKEITGTTGPVDNELITLSLWDKENRMFALLVNFPLHPAILVGYRWLISRDFIHYLDEHILEQYGRQVVTLFANGAEGNINHLNYKGTDQPRSFAEAERIGRKLGTFVGLSVAGSSSLEGKIRFVSEEMSLPLRKITEEEIRWAGMVLERDKDKEEDMFDGIPDKTYARMIFQMLGRKDKACETVLQGMALHDFAFVTFPGEVYAEFGIRVKEMSPYRTTMIIGLANSQAGYIPDEKAFAQGGYEVRTAWTSQLVHTAGNILTDLVKEKILLNLHTQSVRKMERKASDNKYLHKDFHIALNLLLSYISDHSGKEGMICYLKQYTRACHQPLIRELQTGNLKALVDYFREIYKKEEWPVHIVTGDDYAEITQSACPAISHIVAKGGKPCADYLETYKTVYETMCEDTPFEYRLEYFDEETGACKQTFIRKERKK